MILFFPYFCYARDTLEGIGDRRGFIRCAFNFEGKGVIVVILAAAAEVYADNLETENV